MFERFTPAARRAVVLAQEEARARRDAHIGSEHLLLALLRGDESDPARACLTASGVTHARARDALAELPDPSGLDAEALRSLGIDLDEVRRRVEARFGEGALGDRPPSRRGRWLRRHATAASPGHVSFTDDAKLALELSLREAIALRHRHIEAGHLLLGLLRTRGGGRTRVLDRLGVDVAAVRTSLTARLTEAA